MAYQSEQVVSDNGAQFTSEIFQQFLRGNGIKHVRAAPHHPSTNGEAERFVQTFKNGMKAAKNDSGSFESNLARFIVVLQIQLLENHQLNCYSIAKFEPDSI